jgi:hypothetical protein
MAKTDSPKKPRRRASRPPVPTTATDSASSAHVTQPAPTSGSDNPVAFSPTYDEIAQAAYQRYLDRGASDGADLDDWIAAERALKHGR